MNTENRLPKYILVVIALTATILSIPLIGMQFTDEIVWTASDFVFGGLLLLIIGSACAFVLANKGKNLYKTGLIITILSSFLLIWVNLAVGLVGHEGEDINILYFGVIAIGIAGAFISKITAKGMYFTLLAMIGALVVITIIAVFGYLQEPPHNTVFQIIGVNVFFIFLYTIAAIVFLQTTQLKETY